MTAERTTEMQETMPVRTGEELADERLGSYLSAALNTIASISISQFPAGNSNLTYLIQIDGGEYVLRRPPFGNTVKTAHDMRREFEVLSKLSAVYSPAPKPILFCDDESVIGSEFYLMERRRGLIIRGSVNDSPVSSPRVSRPRVSSPRVSSPRVGRPRVSSPRVGSPHVSKGSSQPEVQAGSPLDLTTQSGSIRICKSFIQNLADLHALDYKAAGLGDLGHPEDYPRRQVEGWTKRYFAAKTNEHPELEAAIEWLNQDIPKESGASIVHNDYKFDNVMLDPDDLTRITAVLDWEMVTIGDPLMDLGTALGYWMSNDAGEELLNMPFNPRILMENISRHDLVEMYAAARGITLPKMLFYYVFGTFKIAVIAQQIYSRFVNGSTRDARFKQFGKFVSFLGKIASNAIGRGSI